MGHKSGDMRRPRQATYHRGRRDLAEEILTLLREGKPDRALERVRAEIKQEGGHGASERA